MNRVDSCLGSKNKRNFKFLNGFDIDNNSNKYIFMKHEIKRQLSDIHYNKQIAVLNNISPELITKAKLFVTEAIDNKMIFSIYGPYERIRCILRERGWVEKKTEENLADILHFQMNTLLNQIPNNHGDIPNLTTKLKNSPDQENIPTITDDNSQLHDISSQLVVNCVPDFIWSLKMGQIDMKNIKPNQILNHFRKAGSFTTKTGLIKSFNSLRWYEKDPNEVFPRSYIISDEEDKKAFLNDYYLTACLSMLRLTMKTISFISESSDLETNNNLEKIKNGTNIFQNQFMKSKANIKEQGCSQVNIDRRYPELAIQYCQSYLKRIENKDLDNKDIVFCSNKRWEDFFQSFWNVTFEGYGIECTKKMRDRCIELCNKFKNMHLQYSLDGTKNIWIAKPGAKSRGRGISCISKFSELSNIVISNSEPLIIQKYIECPLLVYNTKFDIRQWFLVTNWNPLTVWWYKDSYIRFCSQEFTLNDFNEAVHLSNNSIQNRYQNGPRSNNLPNSNMWEWETMEQYLNENGYENRWKNDILPSMKNIIIDVLLCSQEEIEDRKNSFELYGADFMVSDGDLKTWLLEINSSPCMAPSTYVTARLTKSVLEDVIKVILDYPKNIYCDTGQFELLFKQAPFLETVIDKSLDLPIIGNAIKKTSIYPRMSSQELMKNVRKYNFRDKCNLKTKVQQTTIKDPGLTTHKLDELDCSDRNFYKHGTDERYISKGVLNTDHGVKHKRSQSQSHRGSINTVDPIKPHTSLLSGKNLPIIKSRFSKSLDKRHYKTMKQLPERNLKVGYVYENSLISRIKLLKTAEGNNNKRIEQLLKAYLPNLVNK